MSQPRASGGASAAILNSLGQGHGETGQGRWVMWGISAQDQVSGTILSYEAIVPVKEKNIAKSFKAGGALQEIFQTELGTRETNRWGGVSVRHDYVGERHAQARFGEPCRGRTYGQLIKSLAEDLPEDTQ